MIKTCVLKLANGTAVDLLGASPVVPIGMSGTVVTAFDGTGVINVFVCPGGAPPVRISNDRDATLPVVWPATLKLGRYTVVVQQWAKAGEQDARRPVVGVILPAAPAKPVTPATTPAVPPDGVTAAEVGTPVPVSGLPLVPYGFTCSDVDPLAPLVAGIARLKTDGGTMIRTWHGGFGDLSATNKSIIDYAVRTGVGVILTVQPKDDRTAVVNFGTPDAAGFVRRNAAYLAKCAYVGAGNEMHLDQYRPDDWGDSMHWHQPYVDRFLRPLHAALQAIGVKVLCTSITDSWHAENYALHASKLIAAGAKACCDGVDLHLYWRLSQLATLVSTLTALKAQWGKPLHCTEANVLPEAGQATMFAPGVVAYLQLLRQVLSSIIYYRGPTHRIWPADRCLFDAAGQPTAIYPVVIGALRT